MASTFLGLAYVVGLGSSLGSFLVPDIPRSAWTWGAGQPAANNLVPLLVLTWVFDSAAMLTGLVFGKNKLSPASPNKSWEGVGGGLAAILLLASLLPLLGFWDELNLISRLGAALVLAPAAVLGDLVESSVKREAGAKDSATLGFLPGHGGFLDKMDALLFTAPALSAYLMWVHQWN
jgi:phosphatidate cytidylyltransferase